MSDRLAELLQDGLDDFNGYIPDTNERLAPFLAARLRAQGVTVAPDATGLREAVRALMEHDYARCSGEGHEMCVVVTGDHAVLVAVNRGTPSCIWNVAALYGPGEPERRALRGALAATPPAPPLDVEALIRNIEERIERAKDGASVGELSGSPVGEAVAWELASLLVDITEQHGRSAVEDAIAATYAEDKE